ncbi:hypothetical protein MSPP1_004200 [Malassezia sp. CBS 17886]|nr:hypothetical protein MSPP1_004200 [Malassezia sp. CBS 17886]
MQSHRAQMPHDELTEAAHLAYRLAYFVGSTEDAASAACTDEEEGRGHRIKGFRPDSENPLQSLSSLGIASSTDLLELVCQHATNGFTLADAQLDPIGISMSPDVALINHSCKPNAAVVFPTPAAPGEQPTMQVAALRALGAGEQILASYVDLVEPYQQRQETLQTRYLFTCTCALCMKTARPPGDWIDPRVAVRCGHRGCPGWVPPPAWPRDGPVDTARCPQCGRRTHFEHAQDMAERLAAYEALAARAVRAPLGAAAAPSYAALTDAIAWLAERVPPSHSTLWTLRYTAHVQAIDDAATKPSRWHEATQLVLQLCAGMQAPGIPGDLSSALYPPGHPVRAVLLATLGKLLMHGAGTDGRPNAELVLARQALEQALSEAEIGFGRRVMGGFVGAQVRDALGIGTG